jgi:hypothetical protein
MTGPGGRQMPDMMAGALRALAVQRPAGCIVTGEAELAGLLDSFRARTGVVVLPGPGGSWHTAYGVPDGNATWYPRDRHLGPLLARIEAALRRQPGTG